MSAISTYLEYIRTKIYAKDVRTAIVNAISQCYDDVNKPALQTEAMRAAVQAKIDSGQMAALTIADGSLTGAKLADGTIPTAKIADGAITAGKLANGAVATDRTLTQAGIPADAKVTGDRLTNLNNRFSGINAGMGANYSTDGFFTFGGLEFSRITYPNNDIGEQMGAPSESTNRIATPKPIYVYHDIFADIDNSGETSKYQMYFFGVDAENKILSKYTYGATKLYLNAGIYYIMVRNSDNSDISAKDFDAIETLVKGYSFIDTSLLTEIDLDKTLVRCVYTVKDGAVVGAKANTTHLSLPPFKTAHTVKAVRTNTDYVLTDTITDENGTITGTYSTADGDALFQKGIHHLTFALANDALEPLSFSAMKTSHVLYATVSERLGSLESDIAGIEADIAGIEAETNAFKSQKIVARNYSNETYYQAFSRTNNSEKGTNLIRLAHITDTHSDAEAWNRFLTFNNYINPHVTAVMHTGDIVKTTALDDYTYITDNLPDMRTILTIGNHDVGNEQGIGSGGLTNADCKQIFVSPLAIKYGTTNVIVPSDSDACYYYTDVKSDNGNRTLRIIVLNSYDYDANTGGIFANRTHIHYSQSQINWLIGVLQDANTNSIPVCICAHECDAFLEASDGLDDPFNMSYDTPSSAGDHLYAKDWVGSPICDLVEAFISGGSISQTYDQGDFTVSVSASFSNTGHFVCWFTGHRHSDHIGFLPGYHQLNIAPANGGMTVTAKYSDLPRWSETKSEDCFNMYSINLATKTIGIVRIGSDVIYSGADRKKTIVSYVKGD